MNLPGGARRRPTSRCPRTTTATARPTSPSTAPRARPSTSSTARPGSSRRRRPFGAVGVDIAAAGPLLYRLSALKGAYASTNNYGFAPSLSTNSSYGPAASSLGNDQDHHLRPVRVDVLPGDHQGATRRSSTSVTTSTSTATVSAQSIAQAAATTTTSTAAAIAPAATTPRRPRP